MLDASTYAGPILVTLVYFGLYYAFQINIMRVKTRLVRAYKGRGEKFDRYFGQDREMLAADRVQLNMLEHMGPFLALMWMTAAFVDVTFATMVGAAYIVSRLLYPLMMGGRLGRGVRGRILFATVIGYAALALFMAGLLTKIAG